MQCVRLSQLVSPRRDGRLRWDWTGASEVLRSESWRQLLSSDSHDVMFDLSGFDFIDADGLLWLLLFGERVRERSEHVSPWLELPRDARQLRYLRSSGFDLTASGVFAIANRYLLDDIDTREAQPGLRFYRVDIESLPKMMRELGSLFTDARFARSLGLTSADQVFFEYFPAFYQVVTETPKNIVQHSGVTATSGFGYMVTSELRTGVTRICVGDTGRGFRASLSAKGTRVEDDAAAIREALLYHYNHREGEGLFRVLQFVSELQGMIKMRSGTCIGQLDLRARYLRDDEDAKACLEHEMKYRKVDFFGGVQLLIDVHRTRESR